MFEMGGRGGGRRQFRPHLYWRLVGKRTVPCSLHGMKFKGRRVAQTTINPQLWISTVFLGINTDPYRVVLFETMLFRNGNGRGRLQARTWGEAVTNHAKMVKYCLRFKRQLGSPVKVRQLARARLVYRRRGWPKKTIDNANG